MKSQRSVVFIAIFVAMFFAVGSAFAANLKVMQTDTTNPSTTGVANVSITLENLSASEASWITASGAAFTIEYGSGLMYVAGSLQSQFFDTFQAQFEAAGSDPMPPTSAEGYKSPLVENNDDTAVPKMTMVAAARCIPGDYKGMVLFTMQVQLIDTDPSNAGTYSITVKPTKLYNEAAGYTDTNGTPIPVVVGSDASKAYTETGAYPVIIGENMTPVMGNVIFDAIVDGEPTISNITQSGDIVTITGTNLANATVTVDGKAVALDSNTDTEITFTAPSDIDGDVNNSVNVTTDNGSVSDTYNIQPSSSDMQDIGLGEGWNWISFNVQPDDVASVQAVLGDDAAKVEQIKTQTMSATNLGTIWIGQTGLFSEIANGSMFKVKVKSGESFTLSITGTKMAANSAISLNNGWTWIAYLPSACMDTANALDSVFANLNQIKSQTQSKTKLSETLLIGDLDQMCSGMGYAIKMNAEATLTYPTD
jgi:hypothetical protein